MKRIIIYLVAIISVSTISLNAQISDLREVGQSGVGLKKTGQTSFNFLQIPVLPRAFGMGNAYTALSQGVESIFSNPAGLTEMKTDFEFFVSSTQWIADIKYLADAVAWNAGNYGAIGLSFIMVDYGSIRGADLVPKSEAETNPDGYILTGDIKNVGAYSFGLSYVRAISTKFAIGGTVKYVEQRLGQSIDGNSNISDNNANKLVFDMGVKYFPGIKSLRLGMSMRNFSTYVQYHSFRSPLPLIFSVGIGMDLLDFIYPIISEQHNIIISTQFEHPNDYTDRVNTGIEYTFMDIISLRTGYVTNHDILGWSWGLGLNTSMISGSKIKIDYSYSSAKYFDGVNCFSINVSF